MKTDYPVLEQAILAVNAGSSSIKFAVYLPGPPLTAAFWGAVDHVGSSTSCFRVFDGGRSFVRRFAIGDHVTAVRVLTDWLGERLDPSQLAAIGHRVVYEGAGRGTTCAVTPQLLEAMFFARSYDSEHLPQESLLIETLKRAFPRVPQLACFDSYFHDDMPALASMTTLPRRFHAAGIRRSGFHGLSCACVMDQLKRAGSAGNGRLIITHLGGGCSVTAVSAGRSMDTSMGVTPAGGMMMATRSGDIDPGLSWRLLREHDISAAQFNHIAHHESGLKGISGTTGDFQQLLAHEASDPAAAEAVAMFCYHSRKQIGAMAAAIGGMDTLVFAGGIGENACVARQRICDGLAFLGIELDPVANLEHARIISTVASPVTVRIVRVDEERIIADEAVRFLRQQEPAQQGESQ